MAKEYYADVESDEPEPAIAPRARGRSIRNITLPDRKGPPRPSRMDGLKIDDTNQEDAMDYREEPGPRSRSRRSYTIWVVAGVFVLALLGVGAYFTMGDTTVTITPRANTVTFDSAIEMTAYPTEGAPAGVITYSLETTNLEESKIVPASGVQKVEEKASGTVTVYNNHSTSPVQLIKNTRFQSPTGLIYRIPASVSVPGKQGATPGQLTVTVFADSPGAEYNIGAVDRFTVPGLKGNVMYDNVYARSTTAFSGGFIGDRPAVEEKMLVATRGELRIALESKARSALEGGGNPLALVSLAKTTFESLPNTTESGGGVRVTERMVTTIPILSTDSFAKNVANSVSADASDFPVTLSPNGSFVITPSATVTAGTPLPFTLGGGAILTWSVDPAALTEALAGREAGAFQTIVSSFPNVDHAEAHIAPFWSSTFPEDPSAIEIQISGAPTSP